MVKTKGRRAEISHVDAATLSDIEQARIAWRGKRVTRTLRLARQQLAAASGELVRKNEQGARWFCLTVKGGREIAVEKLLADANVQALAPREKCVWVKRKKKFAGERLLFPGYVLVRIIASPEAFEGLRMQERHGVTGFVSGPNGYHVVNAREVARHQRLTDDEIRSMKTDRTIAQGDRARITAGLFVGAHCVVLSVKTRSAPYARVLLDADGASLPIDNLPLAFLEKL